jgi:hypothetical protein
MWIELVLARWDEQRLATESSCFFQSRFLSGVGRIQLRIYGKLQHERGGIDACDTECGSPRSCLLNLRGRRGDFLKERFEIGRGFANGP